MISRGGSPTLGFFLLCLGIFIALEVGSRALGPIAYSPRGVSFYGAEVIKVYDGDTITVNLPGDLPSLFGRAIPVRVLGIDAPELRGKCTQETNLAIEARNLVETLIGHRRRVDIHQTTRGKYFRIVGEVMVGSTSIATVLLERGLAVRYDGGTKTKDWCR